MIKINLLESGDSKKGQKKKSDFSLNIPIAAIVVGSVFLVEVASLGVVTYMTNNKIDELKAERNKLSKLEREVHMMQSKIREVKRMIKAVKSLEKGRGKAAHILAEIADTIPDDFNSASNAVIQTYGGSLWLVSVSKNGNTIKIKGKSFTPEAVADYMMRLGALKDVKKVRFDGSGLRKINSKSGIDVYSFSISVTLKG